MTNHIAVDIGASSGRLILATYHQKTIEFEEIHRFKNGFSKANGKDRWNVSQLCTEVLKGLAIAKEKGVTQTTVGIDTWAVDYVLLDDQGQLIDEPVAYRDERTQGVIGDFEQLIPKSIMYQKTGIQFLNFNTLYQLYREEQELLQKASDLLFIPDYIAFVLTGKKVGETSNVSSSQFLNLDTKTYDEELLKAAGVRMDLLPPLISSGTSLGPLKEALQTTNLYPECEVIAVATHDTASAVVGIPVTKESGNWAYLSSGTWSLIGVESKQPINDAEALEANYTNEWGAYDTYRFLKNITGMWSIQEIARMMNYELTYGEMAAAASLVEPFQQFIDLNDERFSNPVNMIDAIRSYCKESGQVVPQTVGELVMAVYCNLALSYAYEIKRIERLTNQTIDTLHVVGGGANVKLLNQLTADLMGIQLIAGPGEGTAIGNILVQMINQRHFSSLEEARIFLNDQIEVDIYHPQTEYDSDLIERFIEKVKK